MLCRAVGQGAPIRRVQRPVGTVCHGRQVSGGVAWHIGGGVGRGSLRLLLPLLYLQANEKQATSATQHDMWSMHNRRM